MHYKLELANNGHDILMRIHLDMSEAILEAESYTDDNDDIVFILDEDHDAEPQALVYHGITYN